MPKANHGPEPKTAPPSLVVLLTSLSKDFPFLFGEQALLMQTSIDRAEVLEERLHELHDAVEKAIERLHAIGDGEVEAEDGLQEALAELNKVL